MSAGRLEGGLSGRDRRALLIGAMVLVPALLFVYVARPFADALSERRDQLAAERDLLTREFRLLAEARGFPDALAAAEAELMKVAPRLMAGSDLLAATASLEGFVAERARAHRVSLQRSETLPPETVGPGLVALRVAIRAEGDLEGLLGFMQSLEAGPKLIRIERLTLERGARRDSGADQIVLSVAALVSAYALEPDSASSAAPERSAE